MQIIPLTNDFTQQLTTVLDGQSVSIRVWYQDIGTGWYITMAFIDGREVVSGFRINTGSPILTSVFSDFLGNLVCIPTGDQTAEPAKESPWGNTHLLAFLTQDESVEDGLETL